MLNFIIKKATSQEILDCGKNIYGQALTLIYLSEKFAPAIKPGIEETVYSSLYLPVR
jgi:hypothetical protein